MNTPIFLSLGSNIDKEESFRRALDVLSDMFGNIDISSVFESKAVGFDSDNFYNCVVMAYTTLSLNDLLPVLRQIEIDFGRSPTAQKNEPRRLDIDLLLFGDLYIESPIKLPRDDIANKAFVLEPLSELIPQWQHPETLSSIDAMWQCFDRNTQPQWKVDFCWQSQHLPLLSLCRSLHFSLSLADCSD